MLDRNAIMQLIPHRPPVLMLDRATVHDDGRRVSGEFVVPDYFDCSFGYPPVYLIEMINQGAGVASRGRDVQRILGLVERLHSGDRFYRGDRLRVEVSFLTKKKAFDRIEGTVSRMPAGEVLLSAVVIATERKRAVNAE